MNNSLEIEKKKHTFASSLSSCFTARIYLSPSCLTEVTITPMKPSLGSGYQQRLQKLARARSQMINMKKHTFQRRKGKRLIHRLP